MSTRILIGALSGQQYPERRAACRATWMACLPANLDAVFLLGDPDLPAAERRGDELWLPCPDDYPHLTQKTRNFCRWALAQPQWDYLFKGDDDTLIHPQRLAAYDPAGHDYIGALWHPSINYASGGAGYLLSRRAAQLLAENMHAIRGAEDRVVGNLLIRRGVPLHVDARFVPFGNETRRPLPSNDIITTHKISATLWSETWAQLGLAPSEPASSC